MQQHPPGYHSLLVTFWEERNQGPKSPNVWRFRLEDPHSGQQQGFTSFEALLVGLEQEIGIRLVSEQSD